MYIFLPPKRFHFSGGAIISSICFLAPLFSAHHVKISSAVEPIHLQQVNNNQAYPDQYQLTFLSSFLHSLGYSAVNAGIPQGVLEAATKKDLTLWPKVSNKKEIKAVHTFVESYKKAGFLNAQTPYGHTALIVAAFYGHELLVKKLLDAGADITKTDKIGLSALHLAAREGRTAVVELLIPFFAKADLLNSQTKKQSTPLTLASCRGHNECVKALIEGNADVAMVDNNGFNALHWAVFERNSNLVKLLIPYFLKAGLINAKDKEGCTALTLALLNSDEFLIKTLIDVGANIFLTDEDGQNILHYASCRDNVRLVSDLIPLFAQHGFLNMKTHYGQTALEIAQAHAHYDTAAEFLLKGAFHKKRVADEVIKTALKKICRLTKRELREKWFSEIIFMILTDWGYYYTLMATYPGLITAIFDRMHEVRYDVHVALQGQKDTTCFPHEVDKLVADYLIGDSYVEYHLRKNFSSVCRGASIR